MLPSGNTSSQTCKISVPPSGLSLEQSQAGAAERRGQYWEYFGCLLLGGQFVLAACRGCARAGSSCAGEEMQARVEWNHPCSCPRGKGCALGQWGWVCQVGFNPSRMGFNPAPPAPGPGWLWLPGRAGSCHKPTLAQGQTHCKTQPSSALTSRHMKLSGLIKMHFFFLSCLLVNKINTGQRNTKNSALSKMLYSIRQQTQKLSCSSLFLGKCVSF